MSVTPKHSIVSNAKSGVLARRLMAPLFAEVGMAETEWVRTVCLSHSNMKGIRQKL